jgi:uncharacterized protein YhhL (DUF1145 family)
LGTIVHVIIAIIVFITAVAISLVINTKNDITNCADIKRQRIFATTTFAMEVWTRCMGFGIIITNIVIIVAIIRG